MNTNKIALFTNKMVSQSTGWKDKLLKLSIFTKIANSTIRFYLYHIV